MLGEPDPPSYLERGSVSMTLPIPLGVRFLPPGKKVPFGVIIMENAGSSFSSLC